MQSDYACRGSIPPALRLGGGTTGSWCHRRTVGQVDSPTACPFLSLDRRLRPLTPSANVPGRLMPQKDTGLCLGGQARGCGARLLRLSPQLSGGAQNSLTCLSHVFRSANALALCYNHGVHKVLPFAAAMFAYRADPRVTGQTTRRASSRTSSGACWGRRKRCRMCLVRVLSCLGM